MNCFLSSEHRHKRDVTEITIFVQTICHTNSRQIRYFKPSTTERISGHTGITVF